MLIPMLINLNMFGGVTPAVPTAPTITPSGGIPYTGPLPKTRDEELDRVSLERERVGIKDKRALEREAKAQAVIADVAARQVERIELDEQKRFDELLRSLQLEGIEFERRYLDALATIRERLIDAEIARRLHEKLDDEEIILMLLLMSAQIAV